MAASGLDSPLPLSCFDLDDNDKNLYKGVRGFSDLFLPVYAASISGCLWAEHESQRNQC